MSRPGVPGHAPMPSQPNETSLNATINGGRDVNDYPAAKDSRRQRKEEAIAFISA